MRAVVGLQDPSMRLLEGRTPLHQLLVPRVRQRPVSALDDTILDIGWGEVGSWKAAQRVASRRVASRRNGGSGAESRAAVAKGNTKNAMEVKCRDDEGKGDRNGGK